MYEDYLILHHKTEILNILGDGDTNKHFSINIDFLALYDHDPSIGNKLQDKPEESLNDWDQSVITAQNTLKLECEDIMEFSVKFNIHCRVFGLPVDGPDIHKSRFPCESDISTFFQILGTVVRTTRIKVLEYQRKYICCKCKYPMIVKAQYELKNNIIPPKKCTNPEECKGTNIIQIGDLNSDYCKDYQEIKIQEQVSHLSFGSMPKYIWATLEDDLVDTCKPGDDITVCGIVKIRWGQFIEDKRPDIEIVLKANHVDVTNIKGASNLVRSETISLFEKFWEKYSKSPLIGRDVIVKSICPQIFGLQLIKLAIAVVLAGGSTIQDESSTGVSARAEPHLLLVGDPGTGKSQLLRFAAKIISRSVLTTGVGSTAAGLTATALLENGEWQLEGGALVLADGGICCIDEFNSMKEHDRTSIHEAMEQQTLSIAKATILCKLSTKCSVLAATNPKGNIDSSLPLSMNITLPSPLLSRFDLIMLIKDNVNMEWDELVTDYILNDSGNLSKFVEDNHWNLKILQAYFAVIKKINPTLTPEANIILSNYYQMQRGANYRNKSRTTIRLLNSLVRLSQGHARLLHHKEVDVTDAIMAVVLVEAGMTEEECVLGLNLNVRDSFPEYSMENYSSLIKHILQQLCLDDLLKKFSFDTNFIFGRVESRYFIKNNVDLQMANQLQDVNMIPVEVNEQNNFAELLNLDQNKENQHFDSNGTHVEQVGIKDTQQTNIQIPLENSNQNCAEESIIEKVSNLVENKKRQVHEYNKKSKPKKFKQTSEEELLQCINDGFNISFMDGCLDIDEIDSGAVPKRVQIIDSEIDNNSIIDSSTKNLSASQISIFGNNVELTDYDFNL